MKRSNSDLIVENDRLKKEISKMQAMLYLQKKRNATLSSIIRKLEDIE